MRFQKWTTRNIIVGLIVFLSVVGVSGAVYYQTSQKTQAIEDNGYYECSGKFDSKMTPVSNMLIILKIINGSNFCDDGWYQGVQECQSILNKQIQENSNSKDPYVRQMMELQQAIVKKLHSFSTEAWVNMLCEKDVDDLQKAYNAYHDYYYQHYSNEEAV